MVAERPTPVSAAGAGRLPDFLVIGAQHAGTTSLYEWLRAHPGVEGPATKELHFFDLHFARGEQWYRSHFPPPGVPVLAGEATPYLLFHPLAPTRARDLLPAQTRFIVLLRNPIDRAVSHYQRQRRVGAETLGMVEAFRSEEKRLVGTWERVAAGGRSFAHQHWSYLARGEYAGQLRRWYQAVGRGRVDVYESESVFDDPGTRAQLLQRLGLPVVDAPFPRAHAGDGVPDREEPEARAFLHDHFRDHNERLFELLGRRLWHR